MDSSRETGINDESEVQRVSIDLPHIHPSVPQINVTSFGLLEKVNAFYDFSWWSGVITQKLADSRYFVYFKHTNTVKEFSHVELRPHVELKDDNWFPACQVPFSDIELRETISLNFTDPIANKNSGTELLNSSIKRSMKGPKSKTVGSIEKPLEPHKKLKAEIDSHDQSLSNGGPSKEVTPVGQTVDTIKKLVRGKKTPAKRAKSVESKRPVNTSAKKKGTLSAGSKGSKALVKAAGDLALTTTPIAVKRRRVNPELSAPVVLGLQCMAMTVPKNKNSKQLVTASPQTRGEPEPPLSGVPLVSKTTDKQVTEADCDTSARRKWGRTFSRNANRKTLLTLNDANEEASVSKSPGRSELELALQLQQTGCKKPVKGKRGRKRTISLNTESSQISPQDLQGTSRAQEDNGKSKNLVDKSLETEPDDRQPIINLVQASRVPAVYYRYLFDGYSLLHLHTANKDQGPSFVKMSAAWKSIETMEAFHLFPQNPHFGPLNSLNESARERTAIHKMVNFSTVFEDVCRLRQNDPRTKIEEKLEILLELETHGFDVGPLTSRLKEMLSLKDEAEAHKTGLKEPKDNIGSERAKIQKRNRDITVIDTQVDELRARREQLVKENEKSELKIDDWEEIVDVHERAIGECDRKIDDLATAPF
ncbi:uncharacterized protein LOC143595995 [Bidens hawaiensis]|uniref:uncharacterized protein LOC143595995 n=1 Tax=Bidens hawaiensis TaxID=980011 RepID=UPI00404A2611